MVADHAASFKIELCPINNNTNAVALSPQVRTTHKHDLARTEHVLISTNSAVQQTTQPHLPDLAGEMMAESMSFHLPRPVLLPRQPLPLPQQAGFLLMPQAPPASAPAASAGTGMGGGSGGGESLAVGVLSVAVACLLLRLLYCFARLLGCKRTEKDQVSKSYYLLS